MRRTGVRKTGFKKTLAQCAVVALAALASSDSIAQSLPVVYRETFNFCTGTLGAPAAEQSGWSAYVTGLRVAKLGNLKVFTYGSTDIGGSVNSRPIGLSQGYSFWARATYGLTIFTTEFPVSVTAFERVDYLQRLSGVNPSGAANATRLALLIGNTWYISRRSIPQTNFGGAYEVASFAPLSELYGTIVDTPGVGPAIPANFDPGVPLPPSGTVRAFGVFLDEVNGRVRVDNFVV